MTFSSLFKCPKCNNTDLSTDHISAHDGLLSGSITCSCSYVMTFTDGILNLIDNSSASFNEKRNDDVYSDFWERAEHDSKEEVTPEMELIKGWSNYLDGSSFIDLGCGNGRHMSLWVEQGFELLIFLDISNSIKECRDNFLKFRKDNQVGIFLKSTIANLPFQDESIDCVWSTGVLGLIEDQIATQKEMSRLSKKWFNLSVLTNKTLVGKVYIFVNIFKPLINRINRLDFLYSLAGFFAKIIFMILKILYKLKVNTGLFTKDQLEKIVNDKSYVKRLQWGLYDPVIIPKITKLPDNVYISTARTNGFELVEQDTKIICDYFFFKKLK